MNIFGLPADRKVYVYKLLYTDYRCYIMKKEVTTIQLSKSIVEELKSIKKYQRETYAEIILDLISIAKSQRNKKNQYDEFLFEIQQEKMKELWDNKEDEAWESV